jgi:hypothetical protein
VFCLKGTGFCIFRDELVGTTMDFTIYRSTTGHPIIVCCLIFVSNYSGRCTVVSRRLNVSNNLKPTNQNCEKLTIDLAERIPCRHLFARHLVVHSPSLERTEVVWIDLSRLDTLLATSSQLKSLKLCEEK